MAVRNLTGSQTNVRSNDNSNDSLDNFSTSSGSHGEPLIINPFLASEEQVNTAGNPGGRINSGSNGNLDSAVSEVESSQLPDYKGYYSKNLGSINPNNFNPTFEGGSSHANNNNNNINNNGGSSNNNNNININNVYSAQSPLIPPARSRQSTPSIATGFMTNDIASPPAFDRYPLMSSTVNLSRLHSNSNSTQNLNGMVNNSSSNNNNNGNNNVGGGSPPGEASVTFSSNPFTSEQDFSPFGGYPTTSFPLLMEEKEDDDYLHNPDPEEEARLDRQRIMEDFKHMDRRSFAGLFGVLSLFIVGVFIFIILPALTFSGVTYYNGKGQVYVFLSDYIYPTLSAIRTSLVDPDTPKDVLKKTAKDGSEWVLVFSDEFNAEGRTFYDGDEQFWTGPDFHYAATNDLEWYTPDACTTKNGTLQLRMDAFQSHNLFYRSCMLQSWNKFCFTQGHIEISANLPNYGRVTGLWPGLWTMGNLGRPGFLASTEGVWPYSYDSCDAGITPNQSSPDGISYLPGQKLNICTCDGEDHPNQGVGRGAPEIDIIEAETDTVIGVGLASQSVQVAPFDIWYIPDYDFVEIYNFTTTTMNTYCGGPFQQAISAVSTLNISWYEFGPDSGYFQIYGYEYLNDDENGYITWYVGDNPTWTIYSHALHPDGNIGWRRISREPMSIIMNLGISNNWAYIDWQMIYFPVTMSVDYVRVYQPANNISVGCDPEGFPTYDYIEQHREAYYNPNMTSWKMAGYDYPKNILTGNCKSSKFTAKDLERQQEENSLDEGSA